VNYENDHVWHHTLLLTLAQRIRPKCYLELGLWLQPVITDVAQYCEVCYGVDRDIMPDVVPPNATFIRLSTDEFFALVGKTIPPPDLVFVDADHRKDQVLTDLKNIEEICAENCIVVLHDTFPSGPEYTTDADCSDSYKVPDLMKWEHVTLPTPPGITICRMKPRGLHE
jgi:hypothetical protein